ncbi:MAG: PIN domain-containing protein [Parcubacteria group bacterium]|nr:PIN domain-containing protein [Parcubacteria group bacterium]
MAKPKVFLDSSVLITAALSARGGSFYILTRFRDKCEFQINEYILEETIRVLDRKFKEREDLKSKLFLLLGWAKIKILPNPGVRKLKAAEKLVNKEDAPVLASALETSSYLLTLDNDFLKEEIIIFVKAKRLAILKPKEFIQKFGA